MLPETSLHKNMHLLTDETNMDVSEMIAVVLVMIPCDKLRKL